MKKYVEFRHVLNGFLGAVAAIIFYAAFQMMFDSAVGSGIPGDNCVLVWTNGENNSIVLETMSNVEGTESNSPGNVKTKEPLETAAATLRELRKGIKESPSDDQP